MQPKVSIVIPVYNVEQYIDRCIQSVLNQTLQDFEIILVDDESPDNCPEICDQYANSDSRIKVVHKANAGLGMACNSGIEVASGRYIAFLDSDDWVDSEMYKTLIDTAERYSAQMVFSGLKRVDDKGTTTILSQPSSLNIAKNKDKITNIMMDMIANPPHIRRERNIAMSAKVVLYSRELISHNNIRFESERQFMSEDLLFNLDCLNKADAVVELPNTFYNYYINNASLSNTVRIDRFEKSVILRQELLRRYHSFSNLLTERINRMTIGYCRVAIASICNARNLLYPQKLEIIKRILSHPIWEELNNSYPIKKMPIHHRIYFMAIYTKSIRLIFFLSKFA